MSEKVITYEIIDGVEYRITRKDGKIKEKVINNFVIPEPVVLPVVSAEDFITGPEIALLALVKHFGLVEVI